MDGFSSIQDANLLSAVIAENSLTTLSQVSVVNSFLAR